MRKELQHVEAAIDAYIANSALIEVGTSQAAWTVLSTIEDQYCKHVVDAKRTEATNHNLLNALTYPLRACLLENFDALGFVPQLDSVRRAQAIAWIEAGISYRAFSTYFPLLWRRKIDCDLVGTELVFHDQSTWDPRYAAYNYLNQQKYSLSAEAEKEAAPNLQLDAFVRVIKPIMRVNTHAKSLSLTFNKRVSAALVELARGQMRGMWTLPSDWQFGGFTLGQFRIIYEVLFAHAVAWMAARLECHRPDLGKISFIPTSGVWTIERDSLAQLVRRCTDINRATIDEVISLLTFGSNGIDDPTARLQPLFALSHTLLALSPFTFTNSDAERNLCTLLNKVSGYLTQYQGLTNAKEGIMREQISASLGGKWRFGHGKIDKTDIDLAIIDDANRICLCVELKWFIAPNEVSETYNREKNLSEGITQAKKIMAAHHAGSPKLHSLLAIDPIYEVFAVVGSFNWIGQSDMQDNDIPIVKAGHIVDFLKESGSLSATITWLTERRYLPKPDLDFFRFEEIVELATWSMRVPSTHPRQDGGRPVAL